MLVRLMRQVALFASLFLALCVLDHSFWGQSEVAAVEVTEHYTLALSLGVKEGAPALGAWQVSLLGQAEGADGAVHYLPQGREAGHGMQSAVFDELPVGQYWVIAHAAGFARDVAFVDLKKDDSLSLTLSPAQSLKVRVMAEKGESLEPLPGATVLVDQPGLLPWGQPTDQAGTARFAELGPGPYRVRIFAPGFESYEAETEGDLLVRLRPVSILRVKVHDGGIPQAEAEVVIAGINLWPTRTVRTGVQGKVDISGLKAGRYFVYARRGDRISQVNSQVDLLPQAGIKELSLELGPGAFVETIVMADEDDALLEKARVTWSSAGLGQFSHHVWTDSFGRARVGPLSEKGGLLSVRADGFVAAMEAVDTGIDGPQVIRLKRAAQISGRVVDSEGFPVPGATVEAVGTSESGMPISVTFRSEAISDAHFDWAEDWSKNPANVLIPVGELGVMLGPVPPIPLGEVRESGGQRLTTDDKGRFVIDNVPPGEVVVLARHPEKLDGKSEVIKLAPSARAETEIVLGEGKVLRGRVLDHHGLPVEAARIRVSGRRFERRVTAESDGTFRLDAAPERVTLRISTSQAPLRILWSHEVSQSERGEEVQIKLPEPREALTIQVLNERGEAAELAQVTVLSLDRRVPFKETRFSNAEGKVLFQEALGLRLQVRVQAPGFVEKKLERRLTKEFKVTLLRSLTCEGRVMGVRGRLPASGAQVTLRFGETLRRATTNDVGEYRLTGVAPGSASLRGTHDEYGKGSIAVSVVDPGRGRPVSLPDLQLTPALEVSGKVENAQGEPVPGVLISSERLSPFLTLRAQSQALGVSDEAGRFSIDLSRQSDMYLYGALPGRLFGWSEKISAGDASRIEDVVILLDQRDTALPNQMGSILVGLEERGDLLVVYAVASESQAAASGLRAEDVLLEIEGFYPSDLDDAREALSGLPGSELRLMVNRAGQKLELIVPREAFLRQAR